MGQNLSCGAQPSVDQDFFSAAQYGELKVVESILRRDPGILRRTTPFNRLSILHIAAANGHVELLSMILERWNQPDVLNRQKQSPLMLAAMRGKIACVEKLLQAGANILMFDSANGRTCLHYAAYYGHLDCLKAIADAAHANPIAESWGFARFINVRDSKGQPHSILLQNKVSQHVFACYWTRELLSALLWAIMARRGCLDCVRELLVWGADRLQMDSAGRIPYVLALKRKHLCAALLNPSAAEPLVWPSPLKLISKLNPDVKLLLETALMEANKKREHKILKGMAYSLPSPYDSEDNVDDDKSEVSIVELCCICFEQACTIEVKDCGHQMCAHCTLAICCHNKPDPKTLCTPPPICPFCRSNIDRLVVAKSEIEEDMEKEICHKSRKSRHFQNSSEGSSSFKGLSSGRGSFGIMGRGSGRIADSSDLFDKA
ncbi:hypothetical protein HPP92_012591 [Vanilla planifolia]|uniref:RING-type E3 ubiquitin transferase n=1 Tax=Vanilla planifolia TaxID=51239 RepID=A0A835V1W2_VANPL|nr:hypothetical protein HPP92_012591 [Vanilla planifolia]